MPLGAHARRYFKEAMPTATVTCAQVLAIIGQLYGIERAPATSSSMPLHDSSFGSSRPDRSWRDCMRICRSSRRRRYRRVPLGALPSATRAAQLGCANAVHRRRAPQDRQQRRGAGAATNVLGRKNWLFAGREAAAHRTAILCSLVQTCKHLQINPFVYLRDIIERISTHPARLVLELTPREWRQLRGDAAARSAA